MTHPHDRPTAAELVEAVREFLERDVMDATEGRVQLPHPVAVNVLGMVQRELELGPEQAAAHEERLRRSASTDDAALAAADPRRRPRRPLRRGQGRGRRHGRRQARGRQPQLP